MSGDEVESRGMRLMSGDEVDLEVTSDAKFGEGCLRLKAGLKYYCTEDSPISSLNELMSQSTKH
jgi:hypothetical protein